MRTVRIDWETTLRVTPFKDSYPTKSGRNVSGAAVKAVLLALSTYANYTDGENAHPGIDNLSVAACLSPQQVTRALEVAREERWVERTKRGNRKSGYSDTYRLTLPHNVPQAHNEVTDESVHNVPQASHNVPEGLHNVPQAGSTNPSTPTLGTNPGLGEDSDANAYARSLGYDSLSEYVASLRLKREADAS